MLVWKEMRGAVFQREHSIYHPTHETILRDCDDDGARAFFKWFASDSPCEGIAEDIVNEIAEAKGNLTFYLAGDGFPIFQRPLIKKACL